MAVTRTEFLVNSGNTGWTSEQVLDALELALGTGGAGHHSGTATTGVMRKLLAPTDGWSEVGGQIYPISNANTPTRNLSADGVSDGTYYAEWDVQLTAPGGGTAATVTVRRYGSDHSSGIEGKVILVYIRNGGSGYANDAAITLSAADIGGSTATDITFGTRSATVPAIKVHATQGGATNWWWSDKDLALSHNSAFVNWGQPYAGVCRVTNDANKARGITYYSFAVTAPHASGSFITMKSGPNFNLNELYSPYIGWDGYGLQGGFFGDPGMDNFGNHLTYDTNGQAVYQHYSAERAASFPTYVGGNDSDSDGMGLKLRFAREVDPTDYPLKIVTYRAPVSQDTNYTVFQFQQVINGNIERFATFSLNKGTLWGQNIWDLDHVFQGSVTLYGTQADSEFGYWNNNTNDGFLMVTNDCQEPYDSYSASKPHFGVGEQTYAPSVGKLHSACRARECLFGYQRHSIDRTHYHTSDRIVDQYRINIDGHKWNDGYANQAGILNNSIQQYYRNSNYDTMTISGAAGGTFTVSAAADSHKPLKGLPVCSAMMPCPYYLPDDFVVIQLVAEPGETVIYPGDTITVSGSEVYTVIVPAGRTNQPFFGIDTDLVSRYVVFAARTT